jgi:hypothetical protein
MEEASGNSSIDLFLPSNEIIIMCKTQSFTRFFSTASLNSLQSTTETTTEKADTECQQRLDWSKALRNAISIAGKTLILIKSPSLNMEVQVERASGRTWMMEA